MRHALVQTAIFAVLAAAVPASAAAQAGAGDNQYADPCLNGGCNPSPPASTHRRSTRSSSGSPPSSGSLTQSPPSGAAGGSSPTGPRPTSRHRLLARTGYDVWQVALLGLGVLTCGIGLRLRTAGVRRF